MKKYEKPIITIVDIEVQDIMSTSAIDFMFSITDTDYANSIDWEDVVKTFNWL